VLHLPGVAQPAAAIGIPRPPMSDDAKKLTLAASFLNLVLANKA
jgi:hypothetical protein